MFDRRVVWELARFEPSPHGIVSFFLDVDGSRFRPISIVERTHQLVRQAKSAYHPPLLNEVDLTEITRFIGTDLDRGSSKGVAVYSCQARGLWQVVQTPIPFADHIAVSPVPTLRPLISVIAAYPDFILLLVDRENALFLTVTNGDVIQHRVHHDVPGRRRVGSWYGLADDRIERHIEHRLTTHLSAVLDEAEELIERNSLEHVVIGATEDISRKLVDSASRAFQARFAGRINASPDEAINAVIETARQTVLERTQTSESERLRAAVDEARSGQLAASGMTTALRALAMSAVRSLTVVPEAGGPGFGCSDCKSAFIGDGECPECGSNALVSIPDIAEEAVRLAVVQDADVHVVPAVDFGDAGSAVVRLRFPLDEQISSLAA